MVPRMVPLFTLYTCGNAQLATRLFVWMKSLNLDGRRGWVFHQGTDGPENGLESTLVFSFQFVQSFGKIFVRCKHLAKATKCAHDGHIYENGSLTHQNA
jgi:hypothetical protein